MSQSASQALLLALAERWLNDLLPPSVRNDLQTDFATARATLADCPEHAAWLETTRAFHHWDDVLTDPEPQPDVMDALRQAVFDRHQVDITYRKSGQIQAARIHPFGWVRRNNVQYVACTFWNYADPLWLAVHRIESAESLAIPAAPGATPDVRAAFLDHPPMTPALAPLIKLELEFPQHLHAVICERPPRGNAVEIGPPRDGWFRLQGEVPDSHGLRWWLLGFNDQVRIQQPKALKQELHRLLFDPLTELVNRHEFALALSRRLAETRRTRQPLALVMLDLDYFKQVNDRFGHPVGDQALKHVAACLKASCRTMDVAARYGGEEFILLLPNTCGAEAIVIAERVRQELEQQPLALIGKTASTANQLRESKPEGLRLRLGDAGLTLTASLGVASEDGSDQVKPLDELGKALLKRADDALFQAKTAGRNRVCQL